MTVDTAPAEPMLAGPAPGPERAGTTGALARHAVLALAAYLPLVLTARGRVSADTKSYLYLDPGRLLERAPFMWDPNVGFGTVTHQNIGYLFPMGPWFWAFDAVGLPDWLAQRLWLATTMFAAGAGVLFLLRTLRLGEAETGGAADDGWRVRLAGAGVLAAAAVYMFTPFVVENAARFSVLLLPWAGLPWLVGLTQRALRTGSWRHPAAFAVVVTIVGGVNATALLLAGLGPVLWVVFAVLVHREVSHRRALVAVGKIGLLTVACSLWWIAGLAIQGGYGVDVLRYSESVRTVAGTSISLEVLRGLGYWFFYGGDKVGPWTEASNGYTQHLWLLAAGFAVPLLAFLATASTRWRYRSAFVSLVIVGTAVAVGAYPYEAPSPLGAVLKAAAASSSAGLAMRSTARAVPLVVLGLAVLIAAGLAAASRRWPTRAATATLLVFALAFIGLPPLWTGRMLGGNLQRPEEVPEYWREAAAWLDRRDHASRVLELPGIDFASYRWGTTIDPITPGLIDRPYAARELIPYGSPASADLLIALDRRFQDNQLDPAVLAPVARLLGVGDIVLRSDLQYERFRIARPRTTWDLLRSPPPGLGEPVGFGGHEPNRPLARLPLADEEDLATADAPDPPPVAVFPVEDGAPIVRAGSTQHPLLLAGDGEGVVAAAAAGVLDAQAPLFYSAALADQPDLRRRLLDSGAELVVTDTNRRQAVRWSTLWENRGYTEQAGERPLRDDQSDNRLPLFPDAGDAAFTTVDQRGVRDVRASSYGNPVTFAPEDRPAQALDGDVGTAWRVGDFSPVAGERLRIDLDEPVTTDHLDVVQPLNGPRDRYITRLEVRLDGRSVGTFDLDQSSRERKGQSLDIERHRFSRVELIVRGDNVGSRPTYRGISPVGLAEVGIAGTSIDEVVRLPSDLLAAAGRGSADHDLSVLLERRRSDPFRVGRNDEERSIVRSFSLPTARRFELEGDARISPRVPVEVVDRALGLPDVAAGGLTVTSSLSVPGLLGARATAAVDGDRATAWTTGFGESVIKGAWMEIATPDPVALDHMDLAVLADGRHSVPTRLRLEADGQVRIVDLPAIQDQPSAEAPAVVPVDFAPLTTDHLRVVVEDIRPVQSIDYYSEVPIDRPVGIAELGLPGLQPVVAPATLPDGCRDDLLTLDGRPVSIRVVGSTQDAVERAALSIEPCGAAEQLEMGPGEHVLRSAPGVRTGIDLDRLVLRSPAGVSSARGSRPPEVEVVGDHRTSMDLRVRDASEPFWLILGQSHSEGWTAAVEGGASLGRAELIDGFANGWLVDPHGERDLRLSLEWTPQRQVWVALAVSLLALVMCLAIVVIGWRRARIHAPTGALAGVGPVQPALSSPLVFDHSISELPRRSMALVAVGAGLLAAVLASPLVGIVVLAAGTAALGLGRRGRVVLTAGATGALALAASYVIERQAQWGIDPGFEWPSSFDAAHYLAWLALFLLATDVAVEVVLRRREVSRDRRTAARRRPGSGG